MQDMVDELQAYFWDDEHRIDMGYLAIKHELSCDSDPSVQKWIRLTSCVDILVQSMEEMTESFVHNLISGDFVKRPASTACYCGWVCHQACGAQLLFWIRMC